MSLNEAIESGEEITLRPCSKGFWSTFSQVFALFLIISFILLLLISALNSIESSWVIFSIISSPLLTLVLWKHYQDCHLTISSQCLEIKGLFEKKLLYWSDIQNFRLDTCPDGGIYFFIDMKNSKVIELGNFLLTLNLHNLSIHQLLNLLLQAKEKYSNPL